jgi:hypothetical protein
MTLLSFIILASVISQDGLQPQIILVEPLLVKIVEKKEAQIIPIDGITIFLLIIYTYLINTGQYFYIIG